MDYMRILHIVKNRLPHLKDLHYTDIDGVFIKYIGTFPRCMYILDSTRQTSLHNRND